MREKKGFQESFYIILFHFLFHFLLFFNIIIFFIFYFYFYSFDSFIYSHRCPPRVRKNVEGGGKGKENERKKKLKKRKKETKKSICTTRNQTGLVERSGSSEQPIFITCYFLLDIHEETRIKEKEKKEKKKKKKKKNNIKR